ncbi:alpha/beta fold hydrolase [Sporobolomyces koalae]|uniref:alpha/beta fold hydrolase n=1 Tax=Sporobolomyces koalae TaxID=500713 RepID=UPI00317A7DA5
MAELDPIEGQAKVLQGPLLPLLSPKALERELPRLARRSPPPQLRPGWTFETFTVPAAYPRSFPGSTKSPLEQLQDPTDAKGGRLDTETAWKQLIQPQVEAFNKPVRLDDQEELDKQQQLVLSVNRYRPPIERRTKGLTLVLSHANGFYKEVWEPMLSVLLEDLETANCLPVEEVWALDCVVQGDSAVLNDEVLGPVFNWMDHGRDILNFLVSYIDGNPSDPSSATTPTLKPASNVDQSLLKLDNTTPVPAGANSPAQRKYRDRLIVGIGHSLGGGGTAFAATACPSLFSSVIFLDPVLVEPPTRSTRPLAIGALVRKQKWKTREEALAGFQKKAFFRAWDEQVLQAYSQFGLKDTSEGVALKTTARLEALTFADAAVTASIRANQRLASLPPVLPVHFVWADENRSVLKESNIEQICKRQVPHSTMSRVEGAGHLIVHEKPRLTAQRIGEFLKKTYSVTGAKL